MSLDQRIFSAAVTVRTESANELLFEAAVATAK